MDFAFSIWNFFTSLTVSPALFFIVSFAVCVFRAMVLIKIEPADTSIEILVRLLWK